jgi:hypothetical protein
MPPVLVLKNDAIGLAFLEALEQLDLSIRHKQASATARPHACAAEKTSPSDHHSGGEAPPLPETLTA